MTEKAYRFSASAIDELNKHRGAPTPVEKTICFADGRPGCPAASAVRPDRLVNAYLTALAGLRHVAFKAKRVAS